MAAADDEHRKMALMASSSSSSSSSSASTSVQRNGNNNNGNGMQQQIGKSDVPFGSSPPTFGSNNVNNVNGIPNTTNTYTHSNGSSVNEPERLATAAQERERSEETNAIIINDLRRRLEIAAAERDHERARIKALEDNVKATRRYVDGDVERWRVKVAESEAAAARARDELATLRRNNNIGGAPNTNINNNNNNTMINGGNSSNSNSTPSTPTMGASAIGRPSTPGAAAAGVTAAPSFDARSPSYGVMDSMNGVVTPGGMLVAGPAVAVVAAGITPRALPMSPSRNYLVGHNNNNGGADGPSTVPSPAVGVGGSDGDGPAIAAAIEPMIAIGGGGVGGVMVIANNGAAIDNETESLRQQIRELEAKRSRERRAYNRARREWAIERRIEEAVREAERRTQALMSYNSYNDGRMGWLERAASVLGAGKSLHLHPSIRL
jgi:hypothetical protein